MINTAQSYVANELVHFVGRNKSKFEQFDLLIHIISIGWITHHPHEPGISGNLMFDPAKKVSENTMYNPEVTCFADIPIHSLQIHMKKYSTIGLSFTKDFIARSGGFPVSYIPKNALYRRRKESSHSWSEDVYEDVTYAQMFDEWVDEYTDLMSKLRGLDEHAKEAIGEPLLSVRIRELQRFIDFKIISYWKFFDHSQSEDHEENFYYEREWRIVGNLEFSLEDIQTIFIPQEFSERLRETLAHYHGQIIFTD